MINQLNVLKVNNFNILRNFNYYYTSAQKYRFSCNLSFIIKYKAQHNYINDTTWYYPYCGRNIHERIS